MESPEVWFKSSGKYFKWVEGYSALNDNDLLFLQTECNIILNSLGREILSRETNRISPGQEFQRCGQVLQNTANEINKRGPEVIMLYGNHQDKFIKARLDNLKNHSPKSIRNETWRHDAYDTMLWLVAKYGSFAHSLLVLYSITFNQFRVLNLGEIAGIVEYVIQHFEFLRCAALDLEASKFFSGYLSVLAPPPAAFSLISFIVRKCSHDSISFLSLLVALGGIGIPDLLFQRFRQEQRRWTEQGEVTAITPVQAAIDSQLLHIISEESTLVQLVDELSPCITMEKAGDGSWKYSVKNPLREEWARHLESMQNPGILALRLVCYVFPREKLWEPQFQSDGKLLSPCFAYALKQSKRQPLPDSVTEAVVECLIAKTSLGPSYFSQGALCEAKAYLSDRPLEYLEAAIACRQSTLSRLEAKYDDASSLIKQYQCHSQPKCLSDRRLHAWHLHFFVSHLKVLNLQEKFDDACKELDNWNMPQKASLMESQIILSFSHVASEIWQCLGKLDRAKDYLKGCYSILMTNDANPLLMANDVHRYQIICALADVQCALGEIDDADFLVRKEIERLANGGRLSKALRRLKVSSLDIDIARSSLSSFAQARSKITVLEHAFCEIQKPDISNQLLHIRTLVASARIFHLQSYFSEAIREWELVNTLAGKYSAFRGQGFTFAFSQLSIGLAHIEIARRTNDCQVSRQHIQDFMYTLQQANSIFQIEEDNYWIPTVTTAWLPKVRSEIESLTDYKVSKKTSARI